MKTEAVTAGKHRATRTRNEPSGRQAVVWLIGGHAILFGIGRAAEVHPPLAPS